MHEYIWKKFRIRLNLFRIWTKFRINLFRILFLTDTCIGITKSSEVMAFFPNSKFPDKSSAELTRFDCKDILLLPFKEKICPALHIFIVNFFLSL